MNKRVETGVVQFEDDWPGIFIRGDDCFAYAMALDTVIKRYKVDADPLPNVDHLARHWFAYNALKDLMDLLQSSTVKKDEPYPSIQMIVRK